MKNISLIDKTCVPCEDGIKPLDPIAIGELLAELDSGWQINELGRLYKQYKFDDFISVMIFANKITEIAENQWHHPDLTIAWGSCLVEIWTHRINGLSENDFILAAKIEALK